MKQKQQPAHWYEMYCERYRCHMSRLTCILRQKKYDPTSGYTVCGLDTGCRDCAQGKKIRRASGGKRGRTPAVSIGADTVQNFTIQTTIQKGEHSDMTAKEMIKEAAAKAADINAMNGQDVPVPASVPAEKKADAGPEKKWCAKCRDYHPADTKNFYRDAKSKTGLSSWCRKAQREYSRRYKMRKIGKDAAASSTTDARRELDILEAHFKKQAKPADETPDPAGRADDTPAGYSAADDNPAQAPAHTPELDGYAPDPHVLVLDFSEYPGLLDRIEKLAHRQHRIPEQQVMWWAQMGVRSTERIAENDESAWWAREENND